MSRTNGILLNLNEQEKRYLDKFCCRYRIKNRAKFIRETLFAAVISKNESDAPKLF